MHIDLMLRTPQAERVSTGLRGTGKPNAARHLWLAPTARPSCPLTKRQLDCLRWVSRGKSSSDVGVILRISARTVDYHVAAICERLGVRTRIQAVAIALRQGWLAADGGALDRMTR